MTRRTHVHFCDDCLTAISCDAPRLEDTQHCTADYDGENERHRWICDSCGDEREARAKAGLCVECGGRLCPDCHQCRAAGSRECEGATESCMCEPMCVSYAAAGGR